MNRVEKLNNRLVVTTVGIFLAVATTVHSDQALAGKGGAFVGGMIGGHVLTRMMDNDSRRTQAAEYQAYRSQPQVVYQQAPPPASSGSRSAEQRLNELDSLAAKGYISQSEYKARRQSILDGL